MIRESDTIRIMSRQVFDTCESKPPDEVIREALLNGMLDQIDKEMRVERKFDSISRTVAYTAVLTIVPA